MADRLTQLQDCYDQLATQFYASLRYISLHHSSSAIDPPLPPPPTSQNNDQADNIINNNNDDEINTNANHQSPAPQPAESQDQANQSTQPETQPSQDQPDNTAWPTEQRPDSPATFAAAQHELAHDLILKTQQIEYIVSILPGVENSQERQEERIRELNGVLKEVLGERERVEGERKKLVRRVEGVITAVRR